jgi:hypothetical protein
MTFASTPRQTSQGPIRRITGITLNPVLSPALPFLQHVQVDRSASSWALQHPAFLGFQSKGQPCPMLPLSSFSVTSKDSLQDSLSIGEHAALKSGLLPRLNMLRVVVERLPRHFTPYKHEPSYKLTYYVERLSCGHQRIYYPQAGPMSRRRFCSECAALALPPKKPVTSSPIEQERAA